MIYPDTDDVAPEGVSTPAHQEIPLDTRLLEALESLKASLEYDVRSRRWLVTNDAGQGYKDAYFGLPDKPLRDVLLGWLLREENPL